MSEFDIIRILLIEGMIERKKKKENKGKRMTRNSLFFISITKFCILFLIFFKNIKFLILCLIRIGFLCLATENRWASYLIGFVYGNRKLKAETLTESFLF